jgi:hypothetical protein
MSDRHENQITEGREKRKEIKIKIKNKASESQNDGQLHVHNTMD